MDTFFFEILKTKNYMAVLKKKPQIKGFKLYTDMMKKFRVDQKIRANKIINENRGLT